MDEKLRAVIRPHPPLPFPNLRDQNQLEIDPIRVDAIINAVVRLDPISVHIAWIGFLRAETSVDEYVLNASRPKRRHGDSQSLQKPTAPRSEPEPASYFLQCCPMVTRRQCTGGEIESRNHATSIMSGTIEDVNRNAVNLKTLYLSVPGPKALPSCLQL